MEPVVHVQCAGISVHFATLDWWRFVLPLTTVDKLFPRKRRSALVCANMFDARANASALLHSVFGFNGFRPDAQTTIAVPTNGALGGTCPPSSGGHFCSVFHYGYAMNESIVRARLTYRIGNIWH